MGTKAPGLARAESKAKDLRLFIWVNKIFQCRCSKAQTGGVKAAEFNGPFCEFPRFQYQGSFLDFNIKVQGVHPQLCSLNTSTVQHHTKGPNWLSNERGGIHYSTAQTGGGGRSTKAHFCASRPCKFPSPITEESPSATHRTGCLAVPIFVYLIFSIHVK